MDPEHRDGKNGGAAEDIPAAEAGAEASHPEAEEKKAAGPHSAAHPGDGTKPAPSHPEHDEGRSIKAKLRKKDHEIRDLKKENHDLKDKVLRLAAEMENVRKRLDREKSEFLQFALADVLREMLTVYDNFERALKILPPAESAPAIEGIGLIAKQYMELLRKRGVTEIEAEGRPFDPTVHSAVQSEESAEVPHPLVGEVFQKGYRLHGRLLRPAAVKVLLPGQD